MVIIVTIIWTQEKIQIETDKLIAEYTPKLKNLKTFEDLEIFLSELEKHDLCLVGKRNTLMVFNFSEIYYPPNRVRYAYDNGRQVGKSFISNLYKVLEIG